MALFVNQNEQRSELQRRLAAELQERAKQKNAQQHDRPDGVEDSAYIEGTKKTTGLAWAWILIALIAIGLVIWLIIITL